MLYSLFSGNLINFVENQVETLGLIGVVQTKSEGRTVCKTTNFYKKFLIKDFSGGNLR